jgi:hypothetical protein
MSVNGNLSASGRVQPIVRLLASAAVLAAAFLAGCGQGAPEQQPRTEAAADGLPDVALIDCAVNGAHVLTPRVQPQADGLHLRIENDTGSELSFSADDPEHGGRGAGAPSGSVSYVWPLPPGTLSVKCTNDQADPSEVPGTDLTVVDEAGVWVSTDLDPACEQFSTANADYGVGAKGDPGDPVAVARKQFERDGLKSGDVVERAGYSGGEETMVRVTRAGKVVATMLLDSDGAGGWLPSMTTVCTEPPSFG